MWKRMYLPVAGLIARPDRRVALAAGPGARRPHEPARVGVLLDALIRVAHAVERELIAAADPRDVELHHARSVVAHFGGDALEAVLGPEAGDEAELLQRRDRLGQFAVAAAVAVVRHDPRARHVVRAVLLRDLRHDVHRLAGLVVAVGVAEAEAPARHHERPAGDERVVVEDLLERRPVEVVRVEARLVVRERERREEIVLARRHRVAEHAVARRAHVERRRVRRRAVVPAARVEPDVDRRVAMREVAVLHAAAVEVLVVAALERLHRRRAVGDRLRLLPDHRGVRLVEHREAQRPLVDTQDDGLALDAVVVAGIARRERDRRARVGDDLRVGRPSAAPR